MTKVIDSHSGKKKFLKGNGREGKKTLDSYQRMLIRQERENLLTKKGISIDQYNDFYSDGI